MPTDDEIISEVRELKGLGIGIFSISEQTGHSLETIFDVWERCGPPALSQDKIAYIRSKAKGFEKYSIGMTITTIELEGIAFEAGASIDTTLKYLRGFGAWVNAGRDLRTQAVTSKPEKNDRRHDPPTAHINELAPSQRMNLCNAFLDRRDENKMSAETGIPVSLCRNYRNKLQSAYTSLTHMRGTITVKDISEAYGIELKIAEHLLEHIRKEKYLQTGVPSKRPSASGA